MDPRPPTASGLLANGIPSGTAVSRPERPSSAAARQLQQQQQLQHSAARPLTGASSIRSGGGSVLGGGGPPPSTAMRRVLQGGGSAQLQAAHDAQARPLTAQQGIGGGVKPPPTAGGRQVLDRTFFINELRAKRQQVFAVTTQMQEELEVLEQKKAAAARAEALAGQLKKEVRLLQEGLADHNIVIDKAGSRTSLPHIHAEYAAIRSRNEAQQARVEEMLAQRLAAEAQTKQLEAQASAAQAAIEARLGSLPAPARKAFGELQAEQAALLAEAGRCEEEAAELDAVLLAAEGELGRKSFKQRALELQESMRQLMQRKVELAAAEEASKAPAEEQREAMMARIRRENTAVEQLTSEAKQLQGRVRQLEAQQQVAGGGGDAHAGAADQQDDATRRAKWDELRGKERELTTFVDAFPQRRAQKQAELASKQAAIVRLLEHLAGVQAGGGGSNGSSSNAPPGRTAADSPPGASRASLGAGILGLAGAGIGGSSAAPAAGGEGASLVARAQELRRLQELEAKIGTELQQLRARLAGMQAEVDGGFGDIEALRRAKEAVRAELEGRQRELAARRDELAAQLSDVRWQVDSSEARLKQQVAWPAVDRLAAQLAQVQGQVQRARADIAQALSEHARYQELLPEVDRLVADVNAGLVAAAIRQGG